MLSCDGYNSLEVWIEANGKRLDEHCRLEGAIAAATLRAPQTFKTFLEIPSQLGVRFTICVAMTSDIDWVDDLLVDPEIDGRALCTQYILDGLGRARVDRFASDFGHGDSSVQNVIANVDVEHSTLADETTLVESPAEKLGKIRVAVFRGKVRAGLTPSLKIDNAIASPTQTENMLFAETRLDFMGSTQRSTSGGPTDDFVALGDDEVDPWCLFEFEYGTYEALVFNGVIEDMSCLADALHVLATEESGNGNRKVSDIGTALKHRTGPREFKVLIPESSPRQVTQGAGLVKQKKDRSALPPTESALSAQPPRGKKLPLPPAYRGSTKTDYGTGRNVDRLDNQSTTNRSRNQDPPPMPARNNTHDNAEPNRRRSTTPGPLAPTIAPKSTKPPGRQLHSRQEQLSSTPSLAFMQSGETAEQIDYRVYWKKRQDEKFHMKRPRSPIDSASAIRRPKDERLLPVKSKQGSRNPIHSASLVRRLLEKRRTPQRSPPITAEIRPPTESRRIPLVPKDTRQRDIDAASGRDPPPAAAHTAGNAPVSQSVAKKANIPKRVGRVSQGTSRSKDTGVISNSTPGNLKRRRLEEEVQESKGILTSGRAVNHTSERGRGGGTKADAIDLTLSDE